MPDWTKPMERAYEYYTVEPTTLADVKRLDTMKKASFTRDSTVETLGSASFEASNIFGETYVRGYLRTIQNGVSEKFPLGTYLVQTPSSSFNGKVTSVTMNAYTPLTELKENKPPLGYTVRKGERILDAAYRIVSENCRVPVTKVEPFINKSKNLIPYPYLGKSNTLLGIEWTDNGDGSVTVNGTPTKQNSSTFLLTKGPLPLKPGVTYTLSTGEKNIYEIGVGGYICYDDETGTRRYAQSVTWSDKYTLVQVYLQVNTIQEYNNVVLYPQLEEGAKATFYEPYFEPTDNSPILHYNFVANTDDTWLSFVIDLLKTAKYELGLDEMGRILFQPKQDLESLQPVWTYNDDDESILYSDITTNHDLYGIPNRVEVIYSYGNVKKEVVVTNKDPNSPTSYQNRGRWITFRDTNPSLAGYVTDDQIRDYAERILKELSTVEYTVSYKHAYCPVRVGDCIRLNYTQAGLSGIKAKVISQNFGSDLACPVSEKAVFTQKLWR